MKNFKLTLIIVATTLFFSCSNSRSPQSAVSTYYENLVYSTKQIAEGMEKLKQFYDEDKEMSEREQEKHVEENKKKTEELHDRLSTVVSSYGEPLESESNIDDKSVILGRIIFRYDIEDYEIINHVSYGDSIAMVETLLTKFDSDGSIYTEKLYLRRLDDGWKIELSDDKMIYDIQKQIGTAIIRHPKKGQIEPFDAFVDIFHSDEEFQVERVKFPVGGAYDGLDNSTIDFTPENWRTITRQRVKKEDDKTYTSSWQTDGGMCGGSLKFELQDDGRWYLTEYTTFNL